MKGLTLGEALQSFADEIRPLDVVSIAHRPMMKRRAEEKDIVKAGDIALVVDGDIYVPLATEHMHENREQIAALDDTQAMNLLTYIAHRLARALGIGGDGPEIEDFEEDCALMFLLVIKIAGRINDVRLPECRVTYDLTNRASPVGVEMYA